MQLEQADPTVCDDDYRLWPRAFDDLEREHAFEPLRIDGRIPEELGGTLYFNGPGRFSCFGERSPVWLDGDGAVSAVRVADGRAEGAVRMLQTRSYRAEQSAGRRMYSRFDRRSPQPLRQFWLGDGRNPGNTSVWALGARTYALCAAGLPVEFDREDLSTRGEEDFAGLIGAGFSPHASYCRARRAFYNFMLVQGRIAKLALFEFPEHGAPRKLCEIPLPAASFVHDFMVTERYALFVVPPLRIEALPMLFNLRNLGDCFRWRPEQGSEVIVVPLDEPAAVRRIELDACIALHFANAFEAGSELIADAPMSRDARGAWGWLTSIASGRTSAQPDNALHRLRIDLARPSARWERLSDRVEEQPRISPHAEAQRERFVYTVGFSRGYHGLTNLLRKHDLETGRATEFGFGRESYPSEVVFVPRARPKSEDDGYLLTLVYDGTSHHSYLAIVDATCPGQGPVARLHFDQHLVPPFHGTWLDRRWGAPHPTHRDSMSVSAG